MIIKIKNATAENVLKEANLAPVENLLRSFNEGKHIIIAASKFFQDIIDNSETFGVSTRSSASEALKSQFEYKSLATIVNFYIEVDFEITTAEFHWVEFSNAFKLIIGPVFLTDSLRLQKAQIVCENPSDADFYEIIADHFASVNDLRLCNITYEAINGGGGTTKHVFDRCVDDNKITLCILDNDKKHPNGPLGGTGRQFGTSGIIKTGIVKILDVHEVESLIPFETIEGALQQDALTPQKQESLLFTKQLFGVDESTKFYFDHKKGMDISKILPLEKLYGDYWRPNLQQCEITAQIDCLTQDQCSCDSPCICYEGFGDNILEKSINYITRGNLKRYKPSLSPSMENYWNDIGKLFFSWGCSPVKRRVRLS